jgi:hypothetical protein
MLGDAGLCQTQGGDQIARRPLALPQQGQNVATDRIGERLKYDHEGIFL